MTKMLQRERFVIQKGKRFLSSDGLLTERLTEALLFVSIDNAADSFRRWCAENDGTWKIKAIYQPFVLSSY